MLATSVGGGGGHAGLTVSGTPVSVQSVDIAVGGSGGNGGAGGPVSVYANGSITTTGDTANGLLAQSVGGSGGAAFMTASVAGVSAGDIGVSVGGAGGAAGGSGVVTAIVEGDVATGGAVADAVSAVSVAGGGGAGSSSIVSSGLSGAALSIGVGGSGGAGGKSGGAQVTWTGTKLTTTGVQSVGIGAISAGGSGGRGGFAIDGAAAEGASADVVVGGGGGAGGNGGPATVTAGNGMISTAGSQAPGISASSHGGNGGRGGFSIASTVVSQGSATIGVGGNGGGGGVSSPVTVVTGADIATHGTQSDAIFALSQGGAGGAGGFVVEGGINAGATEGVPSGNAQLTVGGSGGGGGDGDQVSVTNSGKLDTHDFSAAGILAQSLGGNGGRGGSVFTATANVSTQSSFDASLDLGGTGGGSGGGGEVIVASTGGVTTAGAQSPGILAQSVGGNGGFGGNSYSLLVNVNAQTDSSATVTTNVGGSGGSGAIANDVTVRSAGTIATQGSSSTAIFAQSVGGVGGSGGAMLFDFGSTEASEEEATSVQVGITVGGSGGSGASAGDAEVTTADGSTILTFGVGSHGVFAQSVGGGGGDGGLASNYALAFSGKESNGTSYSLNVDLGGSGGAAGDGAAASVDNGQATVSTEADASHSLFAQSVGGGGGTGGSGAPGIDAFTTSKVASDIADAIANGTGGDPYDLLTSYTQWGLSIGGRGGAGGDGGSASVTNAGQLATAGDSSYGIFAQSVGGGGGSGGSASQGLAYSVAVGGRGSAKGDGGAVTVTNAAGAGITTYGIGSLGILAQSIGGGGGETGIKGGLPVVNNEIVGLLVGGASGASGSGGRVEVSNTATAIETEGPSAIGIFAQSIGGGGGLGTSGAGGTTAVGGSGGSVGSGGAVVVRHSGSIRTGTGQSSAANAAAHGIVAQSVGGGGGYGGAVLIGPTSRFGADVATGAAGSDASGNGGSVTVTASGPIVTTGGSSIGIFAQSVGGGGGVIGSGDSTSALASSPVSIGSGGGSGYGGSVEVTYSEGSGGGISTSGSGAHGIFAQSAGNSESASAASVTVTALGDVSATGPGSHGIFAQAENRASSPGPVEVTVGPDATVTGGGVATVAGAENGAGVFIKGGTSDSTIINEGVITSVLGAAGVAINVVDADVQIENTGTITGQVLKASSIDFRNRAGGIVNAGAELQADRFLNQGLLTISTGRIDATNLSGGLLQDESGVIAFDVDPSRPPEASRADRLAIAGSTSLAGRLRINMLDPWQPEEGRQAVELLDAGGALTAEDLTVVPSVVGQYRLRRAGARTVGVSYDIDFRNPAILGSTNDNQNRVARHVHGAHRARALNDGVALALIGIEERADYRRVMNTLGAEVALDNQIVSLLSGLRFGDDLLGCAERTGTYRFFDDGRCGWLQFGGSRFERNAGDDSAGFDANLWQVAGGLQTDIDAWSLGAAISYETVDLGVTDSYASSDGHILQVGASAKRRFGATELSVSLALGYGDFDIDRDPLPGISIGGDQRQWSVSGQVRAAHLIERGGWSFKPRIDLGVDYLSMNGFEESDGPLGLEVSDASQTYVHLQPAIDIGTEFEAADVLYRPKLTLGVTQFLGDSAPSVDGRLAGVPSTVSSFTARTDLDRTRVDVAASLDAFTRNDLVVRGGVATSIAENSVSYGASLRIEIPF